MTTSMADEAIQANIRRAEEMAARAKAAGAQLAALTVSATSYDEEVTVTVGSGGILKGIVAGRAAAGLAPDQLCAAIMQAYAVASRRASEQASEVMASAIGRDTESMRLLRAAMPPEPPLRPDRPATRPTRVVEFDGQDDGGSDWSRR